MQTLPPRISSPWGVQGHLQRFVQALLNLSEHPSKHAHEAGVHLSYFAD